ncbi:hypothetical protein [Paraburkholderia tropica]|uniref:hypothetical protein n=1 Tax=Paraburkholderia tropica TaxID=92647 RepID=UPI002AB1478D|nr:hypothetical protein [Paraburkholderia tropica]
MSGLLEQLRQSLRSMKPDGENGFEGLIAAVLSDLTGRSFALASAGSQHGRDGQSALDGGVILFEAKRYDDAVPKDKVFTKLLELFANGPGQAELYILAATSSVSAQHINTLTDASERLGMSLVVLTWPDTELSTLATLLAMSPDVSAQFLARYAEENEDDLRVQLATVRAHPQFLARADELRSILQQPSLAPAYALANNRAWLEKAFSDKAEAKSVFGQALSPADTSTYRTLDRPVLRDRISQIVFGVSDNAVVAIVGADGNGKSWIFAQAWCQQQNPPLTVVVVPDDVASPPSLEYCQDLLISKLLTQTGELRKADARERWLKHFERWQKNRDLPAPRLVVFVDGINQRANVNWLKFMDDMSTTVTRLGGRLAFSCRRIFYRDNLDSKLISRVIPVDIPEWSDPELEMLLAERGASMVALDPGIVRSLRNPRIFGIAASLFNASEITAFGELSVNRLLFEHIQSGTAAEGIAPSSRLFVADICSHAEAVIHRLRDQTIADVNEFEFNASAHAAHRGQGIAEQYAVTAAGRFFEEVEENPNKYLLKDEGLPLALGLALVRKAREANRKQKDIDAALSHILDPIAALDRTGDILLSAILTAVLERSPAQIVTPLVRSFVMLQNLDSGRYPEFRALFKRQPDAFLGAMESVTLSRTAVSNLTWLTDAMDDLEGDTMFESALAISVHRWLRMYSLASDRLTSIPNTATNSAERAQKLSEREEELSQAIASLSVSERILMGTMVRQDAGNYSELGLVAFRALAGRPKAPYAESLRNWCFATSLNGGFRNHHKEFNHLLHFNLVDWGATKEALQHSSGPLREPGTSETGLWALVYLLRVTGDEEDAKEADQLVHKLTVDREHFKGWRLIENYCATDPCDPASEKPDNIDTTADNYRSLDPSAFRKVMGITQEDRFYTDARPGLARFRPEVAVEVLRAFADQAVSRALPEFRLAAFVLHSDTVALEDTTARSYVDKARALAQAALDNGTDPNSEAWVAAQYALSIAFPHMAADEQFDVLVNHPKDQTILVDLACMFLPIDPIKLERTLDVAVRESDTVTQFRTLCFAGYSDTPLTERVKELVLELLVSLDHHVRLSVLFLIRSSADPRLLSGLANSNWSAEPLDVVSEKIEILYGSQALVLAAEQGYLSIEPCLDRIALPAYDMAVERLGAEAATAVGARLATSIKKAADFRVVGNLPHMEQHFENRRWPVTLEVSENPAQQNAERDRLARLPGSSDAWYERERQNEEAADRFERDTARSGAQIIIHSVTPTLIAAIDSAAPAFTDHWVDMFTKMDDRALSNLRNLATLVAGAAAKRNAASSFALLDRLSKANAPVLSSYGRSEVPLDSVAAWEGAGNPRLNDLCFARLDRSANDYDLSLEVLAAIRAERLDVLRDYVIDRRSRPEPAHRARATMVAGLSPDEPWAIETVEMLKDKSGFLHEAYKAARYALERHQWSRHWARQIQIASTGIDFWRASVLLAKIVDGRFSWSDVNGDAPTALVQRFAITLEDPIRGRIQKWKSKRESKLFGMDAPETIFLNLLPLSGVQPSSSIRQPAVG